MAVYVMGRYLGEAEDFDVVNEASSVQWGGFVPAPGVALPPGIIAFDYESGEYQSFDVDGQKIESGELLPILSALPRAYGR